MVQRRQYGSLLCNNIYIYIYIYRERERERERERLFKLCVFHTVDGLD